MSWLVGFLIKRGLGATIAGWIPMILYAVIAGGLFFAGWTVRDWKCDAAFYKAENARLTARIDFLLEQDRKQKLAAKEDQEQGVKDAAEIDALETKLEELKDALPATSNSCIDTGTLDRLRRLWE